MRVGSFAELTDGMEKGLQLKKKPQAKRDRGLRPQDKSLGTFQVLWRLWTGFLAFLGI